MRLSQNFTLAEFTKSQTASRMDIDNTPQGEHLDAAKELFENVVQPVRDTFGVTVINSGYRSPDLNEAVGGSSRSQHCKGQAVVAVSTAKVKQLTSNVQARLTQK